MAQSCPQCTAWKRLAFSFAWDLRELFGYLDQMVVVAARLEAQLDRYAEDFQRVYQAQRAAHHDAEHDRQKMPVEQSHLLGIAAHEMRNPLTVIQGFSELLVHGSFPPEQTRQFLQEIHGYAAQLSHLLNDLLSYEQAGAGRISFKPRPVDLLPLLWEAADVRRSQNGQHTISLEVPDDLPPVWADPIRLRQILDNLLSNACKYSHPGCTIRVAATILDQTVCISITDAGLGIPSDQLETIFEPFYRLSRDTVSGTPGTGLGLSIVRQLVDLHGGRIWAESTGEGKGATFSFTIPTTPAVGAATLNTVPDNTTRTVQPSVIAPQEVSHGKHEHPVNAAAPAEDPGG